MNLLPARTLALLVASDDVCSARLDRLLAIYREYDLPFPPSDAKLVWLHEPRGKYLEIHQRSAEDEKFHRLIVKEVKH